MLLHHDQYFLHTKEKELLFWRRSGYNVEVCRMGPVFFTLLGDKEILFWRRSETMARISDDKGHGQWQIVVAITFFLEK